MNQEKNECIQCSIHNCVHHAGTADYCTLDRIHVGTHERGMGKAWQLHRSAAARPFLSVHPYFRRFRLM